MNHQLRIVANGCTTVPLFQSLPIEMDCSLYSDETDSK
jgi:hypothetical protein